MWLIIEKENGETIVVNKDSVERMEKVIYRDREEIEYTPIRKKRLSGSRTIVDSYNKWETYQYIEYRFNIYFTNGNVERNVSSLKVKEGKHLDSEFEPSFFEKEEKKLIEELDDLFEVIKIETKEEYLKQSPYHTSK